MEIASKLKTNFSKNKKLNFKPIFKNQTKLSFMKPLFRSKLNKQKKFQSTTLNSSSHYNINLKSNRQRKTKETPESYFRVLSKKKNDIKMEEEIMEGLFNIKKAISPKNKPKSDESLEFVKLGQSIHFSRVLNSNQSDMKKESKIHNQSNILSNSISFKQNAVRVDTISFQNEILDLREKLNYLNIGNNSKQYIRGFLDKINKVLKNKQSTKVESKLAFTFGQHLKENMGGVE